MIGSPTQFVEGLQALVHRAVSLFTTDKYGAAVNKNMSKLLGHLTQEVIVFLLAATLFLAAAIFLPGFMFRDGAFQAGNLIAMVRAVSVLGILAVGMGIVIIG